MGLSNYLSSFFRRKKEEKTEIKKEPSLISYLQESCDNAKKSSNPLCLAIFKLEDNMFHNYFSAFLKTYLHSNNGRYRKDLVSGAKTSYLIIHENLEATQKYLEDFIDKAGYFYPKEETGRLKAKIGEYSANESYKEFLNRVQNLEPKEYTLRKKD